MPLVDDNPAGTPEPGTSPGAGGTPDPTGGGGGTPPSPPKIFNVAVSCDPVVGSVLTFVVNKVMSGTSCSAALVDKDGNPIWGGSFGTSVNAKAFRVEGTPNGDFTIEADNGLASSSVPVTIACAAVPGGGTPPPVTTVTGCTDVEALNYNAVAKVEDGSCQYTPPAPLPAFFQVPLLQTLRFIVRGGAFETLDNVLFCEQTRPGQQVRPYFYQLVEFEDVVRVQVLSSYPQVAASLFRHGGAQVGPDVPLTQVLKLNGPATPIAVVLKQDVASGTTQLRAATGGALPPSLLAAARLTLGGAAAGTYRITDAVPGSVVSPDDYLVLNRPWVAVAGAITATWLLSGPGFNVWEVELPLAGLAAGYYQVRLRASGGGFADAVAESEPLHLKRQHANTVVLDYANADNGFGLVFSTGITPRLRVPGTFFRQGNGGSESTYRATSGTLSLLSSTGTRLRQLETYALPAYLHEKLFLVCRLDALRVNGVACVTDQSYEVSEQRTYPLAAGRIVLEEVNFLGAGNGDDLGIETGPDNGLLLRGGGYLLLSGN